MLGKTKTLLVLGQHQSFVATMRRIFYGEEYQMLFVQNAKAGLAIIHSGQVLDALVVELDNKEKGGVAFLQQVAQSKPDLVRLALSADLDQATANWIVNQGLVQQIVPMPANHQECRQALANAFAAAAKMKKLPEEELGAPSQPISAGIIESQANITLNNGGEEERPSDLATSFIKEIELLKGGPRPSRVLLQEFVTKVCHFGGWPVGHVYQYCQEENLLKSLKIWYLEDRDQWAEFRQRTEANSLSGRRGIHEWVLAKGKTIWIDDCTADPHFDRNQPADPISVLLAVPIKIRAVPVAIAEFFPRPNTPYNPQLIEYINWAALHISHALERDSAIFSL